jgi:hypothetical protein
MRVSAAAGFSLTSAAFARASMRERNCSKAQQCAVASALRCAALQSTALQSTALR